MGIEQELEPRITELEQEEPDASPLAKGIVAYVILQYFERTKTAIETNNKKTLTFFQNHEFETIQKIVTAYQQGTLPAPDALAGLEQARMNAEIYLRQRGFNPDEEKAWSDVQKKSHEEAMAQLNEGQRLLDRIEKLLEKYK